MISTDLLVGLLESVETVGVLMVSEVVAEVVEVLGVGERFVVTAFFFGESSIEVVLVEGGICGTAGNLAMISGVERPAEMGPTVD